MSTTHFTVIRPGCRSSGVGYLQSQWAAPLPDVEQMAHDNWGTPTRTAWVHALSSAIQAHPHPVVVANSLGCIATVHLSADAATPINGALLVAPADPEWRAILSDFAPVSCQRLPYRHVLLGHDNHLH